MKKLYFNFLFLFFLFFFNSSFAQDSLTLKQQLDRIMEEVKDLNKAVFNKSFESDQLNSIDNNHDTERFTSIDIRIYDLEKDIKNLTLQFEEILFKLDDTSEKINSLEIELIKKLEKIKSELNTDNINSSNLENIEESSIKEENTLGKIIISDSNELSTNTLNLQVKEEKNDPELEVSNLTPEEKLQFALDQMMKKNYNKSNDKKTRAGFRRALRAASLQAALLAFQQAAHWCVLLSSPPSQCRKASGARGAPPQQQGLARIHLCASTAKPHPLWSTARVLGYHAPATTRTFTVPRRLGRLERR